MIIWSGEQQSGAKSKIVFYQLKGFGAALAARRAI
jgi:hypothetical protein